MLVVPRYRGVELPVHSPDAFVANNEHLRSPKKFQREVLQRGEPTFLRAALIEFTDPSLAPQSLEEILEKTDEELAIVAELCGAVVAKHEWGLYPVRDQEDFAYKKYLPSLNGLPAIEGMPAQHILVADVEIVKTPDEPVPPDEMASHAAHIRAGLHQYFQQGRGSLQLHDFRRSSGYYKTRQFILGESSASPDDGQPARHVADIEPRFALTR